MAYPNHQTRYFFTPSSTMPNHSRHTMGAYHTIEPEEALPLPPPSSLPPFGPATTAHDGVSETSAASSLSDIVDGLPTALKSSLGPLRTIRRSMSIRGWVSYLHEVSTTNYNSSSNNAKTSSLSATSSLLSLSSTAFMSPYSSTCSSASSVAAGADEEPTRYSEDEKRSNKSGARGTVVAGSELQQQQQQQQNHNQHQQQQMNTGCRRWTRDWTSHARRQVSDPRSNRQNTSISGLVEYAEPQRSAKIDRFSGAQGQFLVNNALAQSLAQPLDRDRRVRSAYVQGVAWLLAALPGDLDDHEHAELQRALPDSLRRRIREDERQAHIRRRSVIHHAVTILCLQLYALSRLVLALMEHLVHWDRKYRVTECASQWSARMALMVGRGLVVVLGLLYAHGGARLSAGMTGAVVYVVNEVAKGVHDATVEGEEKHGYKHGNG